MMESTADVPLVMHYKVVVILNVSEHIGRRQIEGKDDDTQTAYAHVQPQVWTVR